ncbi:GFA family protein [Novacetimonas pomaceti]|uniref:Aldehyde-activating protein n=1 Tax=Novacetimonas pomaceti TaxID=2021998 RepID=A0A318QE66_9PROT|nr:GFA family protein [Novacetimonas pomaceti]PYD75642.1 aldehyde-activating protein [Novacetimonas pomaceti]
MATTITGSCLCGGVEYEITAPPLDFVLCHCSRCRKASGSSFAANLIVRPGDLHWRTGAKQVQRWDLPTARSFATATCATCHTPLPHRTRDGTRMIVPAGTLDTDPGLTPRHQIFTTSKARWCIDVEDIPATS